MEPSTQADVLLAENSSTGMGAILQNPETWLVVAFVIFMAIFIKFVFPKIAAGLDKRADDIRFQLEQASRLRVQAETLLAQYETERAEHEKEAQSIIASAQRDADALRARAAAEVKHIMDRRSQQALENIARAELEAVNAIRTRMVDMATLAAQEIIRAQLDSGAEDSSIALAISAIESQIH